MLTNMALQTKGMLVCMKYALNLPNLTSKDVLPHLTFLGKGHHELDMASSINYALQQ
jgi:hypothetical protein